MSHTLEIILFNILVQYLMNTAKELPFIPVFEGWIISRVPTSNCMVIAGGGKTIMVDTEKAEGV
jgi:hypothetical protein